MKEFLKGLLVCTLITLVYIGCATIVYKKKIDIPLVGDSTIAFTIRGEDYSADEYKTYSKKEITYDATHGKKVYIVNKNPNKYRLRLTNLENGEVFKPIQHRDTLKHNKYLIERLSLDGKIVSTHELTIVRQI